MSAPITAQEAKDMVKAYLSNPNTVKTKDESGTDVTLKGITFDKSSLEAILNPADGTVIDGVFFALAVKSDEIPNPPQDQNFTLVAIGIDDSNELKIDNAFDHAFGCPPHCPINYNSLFD